MATAPEEILRGMPKAAAVIGIPTEVKPHEHRVGMTPGGAREFVNQGHTVLVQSNAGVGSGFDNESYVAAGCKIVETAKEVYLQSKMIIKVKEPLAQEYDLIQADQIIFTYFHFAANKPLTDAMIKSGCICIAYETIAKDGQLPLLVPMSEVAGRMSVQEASKYLEKAMGGFGILLGGVPGVPAAKVVILGGGIVGTEAARVAAGMGADVTILDINLPRMRYLSDILPRNARTIYNTEGAMVEAIKKADVVIGSILLPGRKAPKLVKRHHIAMMKKGSVVIDVAIDQGGCFETSRPTTHDAPTYEVDGVVHYCVANMPGGVPFTSTMALTNATLRYGLAIAKFGWVGACHRFNELKSGVNIADSKVLHPGVADAFDYELDSVDEMINSLLPRDKLMSSDRIRVGGKKVSVDKIKQAENLIKQTGS